MFRAVFSIIVLGALSQAAELHHFRGMLILTPGADSQRKYEIPQRCIDNSVTPVSCANVTVTDALMAHPDDCNLFYYCVNQFHDPVCRACPAGLHFSPTEHVCDQPAHAGCALHTTYPEPETTTYNNYN